MRRRHTEEQILGILHEAGAGRKVDELCRAHGIAKHTYYRWRAKSRGPAGQRREALARARGRESQIEIDRRRSHARQPDAEGVVEPKVVTPAAQREAARVAGEAYGHSERHACALVGACRAMVR
jgi:hypothetical protein